MVREKYSYYEFSVKEVSMENGCGYVYEIYTDDPDYKFFMKTEVLRESDEWFESKNEARFAAIGHISLLENGEG